MTLFEIRRRYLDFFAARGHVILPSAPLVPENDPTTLFTGSGMQPMVPYLLGEKHPKGVRLTDSQKCFRTQDIEEVGDNRHTTFFEMLGNWSLGDYFKREQITWLFEFLTQELGIPAARLWVTCFEGDRVHGLSKDVESPKIWAKLGLPKERIRFYGSQKNWWSRAGAPENMPVGEPGGPDTEVFYEFTQVAHSAKYGDECHPNCDCGRFLEIGNSVFMEYKKTTAGFVPLPQKNVDFGGGLERLAAATKDHPDIFRIDIFERPLKTLERVSNKKYGAVESDDRAFRVILDHLRAATFLIGDGVVPSNKDQGYFTRRLMRRAIRFAHLLGISADFCGEVAQVVIDEYVKAYPALVNNAALIVTEMRKEEEKFRSTLIKGLKIFEQAISEKVSNNTFAGKAAFDLYQSYGFPVEMIEELSQERGFSVDREEFQAEITSHQELSRKGSEKKFHGGLADQSPKTIMGHTATHLLHAALRKVLGEHVKQSGSNITPERLRFDFTHPQALTEAELRKVEELINAAIARDFPVSWQEMTVDEAYKKNAIGFFPERYDEKVKVYSIGDPDVSAIADPTQPTFSQEICGGPHVAHTGVIGHVRIVKEEALGAGMRRIKAVVEPPEAGEVPVAQNRTV